MRRARIKAVATVPVRRKVAQDTTPAVPPVQTDATESEKPPDKNEQPKSESVTLPVTVDVQEQTKKVVDLPQSSQESPVYFAKEKDQESENVSKSPQKVPISPVKEKESSEVSLQDSNREHDSKINSQPSKKCDTSQKPSAVPVEGSPVKAITQSRSHFMRPTPRLDGSGRIRRNSIQGSGASASESEDDSRRSSSVIPNRVRNDSICSTLSLKDTGNVGNISKLNLGQKRRMVVSESARKLAEARREFLLKHENQPPDKSKLTMYDLIYYNPVTNPMKPKPTVNRPVARKNSICSIPDKKEEEIVDEPEEMLVPQVKVGPNGQLIIDEQSLVIDQYKAQENIDRSDILVDDETNSGFYKRRSKSKDWNKWETLRFYKALNTYGTDFLLMQRSFPNRTRQELKLKYKKEEKINHNLVEKALVYQEFDTEALEKDFAKVKENERLESESNKKAKEKEKKKDKDKKRKRARCLKLVEELNCEDDQNYNTNKNSDEERSSDATKEDKLEKPALKKRRVTRKRKTTVLERHSSNKSLNNDSDSDPEMYEVQTTRSGRTSRRVKKLQKPKKLSSNENKGKSKHAAKINDKQNNNENEVALKVENIQCDNDDESNEDREENTEKNTNKNENFATITTDINISTVQSEFTDMSNMETLQPGSWVVLTTDSVDEPGKKIIQHYIVGDNYDPANPNKKDNFIPITLPPDIIKTVTNCIQNIQSQNVL